MKINTEKDSNDGNSSSSSSTPKSESNKSSDNNRAVSNRSTNNSNIASNSTANATKKEELNTDNKVENNSSDNTPGTFKSSDEARKYAESEISRLGKANKKYYRYTLDRNNKGEVVVNIKEGKE